MPRTVVERCSPFVQLCQFVDRPCGGSKHQRPALFIQVDVDLVAQFRCETLGQTGAVVVVALGYVHHQPAACRLLAGYRVGAEVFGDDQCEGEVPLADRCLGFLFLGIVDEAKDTLCLHRVGHGQPDVDVLTSVVQTAVQVDNRGFQVTGVGARIAYAR